MAIRSITPFLWFDRQAEEAATFYVSLFDNSRITHVSHYGDHGPMPKGTAMVVDFELEGRRYNAMNAGPHYKLNGAFSLLVGCTEQADIDRLWTALGQGGKNSCESAVGLTGASPSLGTTVDRRVAALSAPQLD